LPPRCPKTAVLARAAPRGAGFGPTGGRRSLRNPGQTFFEKTLDAHRVREYLARSPRGGPAFDRPARFFDNRIACDGPARFESVSAQAGAGLANNASDAGAMLLVISLLIRQWRV